MLELLDEIITKDNIHTFVVVIVLDLSKVSFVNDCSSRCRNISSLSIHVATNSIFAAYDIFEQDREDCKPMLRPNEKGRF